MLQNKHLNLLLKSLIDSDFLLLEQNPKNLTRSVKVVTKTRVSSTVSLDPLEIIKSLKQFIRLLQYSKKQNSSFLHVVVENKQYFELFQRFFYESSTTTKIEIIDTLPTKRLSSTTTQMLLLLNFPLNNKETSFKRLTDKNIFLVNKVNSKLEKNNYGTYKIFNDLSDFKKIVFLLTLIDQILKK